jgi:hypothetical protein
MSESLADRKAREAAAVADGVYLIPPNTPLVLVVRPDGHAEVRSAMTRPAIAAMLRHIAARHDPDTPALPLDAATLARITIHEACTDAGSTAPYETCETCVINTEALFGALAAAGWHLTRTEGRS